MTITTRQPAPAVVVVGLRGRLVAGHRPGELRQVIRRLLTENFRVIVLNLEHLERLDCCGLGEVVGCHRAAREQGAGLSLVVPQPGLADALRILGLAELLRVHPTERGAIESLNPPRTRVGPLPGDRNSAWSPADDLLANDLDFPRRRGAVVAYRRSPLHRPARVPGWSDTPPGTEPA